MSYNIIETVEYDPSKVIKVKKQIWDVATQTFVPRIYIRYYRSTQTQFDQDAELLEKAYGAPSQHGMWWTDRLQRYVWLAESAETFWTLKNT